MPITAIYSKRFIKAALEAEGLSMAEGRAILATAPANWLKTITDFLGDAEFKEGMSLKELREKFPTALPGDDAAASLLIRIAVGDAGGLVI